MYRIITTLFVALVSVTCGNASPVDQSAAAKVASSFLHSKAAGFSSANWQQGGIADVKPIIQGQNFAWAVNFDKGGFVLVSADDAARPIMGYAFSGSFNPSQMPPVVAEWMQFYGRQINDLRENNILPTDEITREWDELLKGLSGNSRGGDREVAPLLTTTWDQGARYNGLCPEAEGGPGGRVYSGCVATAMSQIINYWRYPQQGTGSHGYYSDYGYLFVDFGSSTYNYNEMNATIGGEANHEMAEIQYHCGVAVDMMYSPNGSGAYSNDAADALKNYFGYNSTLQLEYKDDYSNTAWADLLKSNLDNGWPMYYHGFGSGGHAFNVDGYQGTDYFHFNWGWSGSFNGYFYLSNLNPGGNDFTGGQGAIVNFYPNSANYPYYCSGVDTLTRHNGTIEDGSGPIANYTDNLQCGWLIAPADSISGLTLYFDSFDLATGDILNLYDGADVAAPLVGSYTLSGAPQSVTSNSGKFYIEFLTSGTMGKGWKVHYNSTIVNYCPGITEYNDAAGTITDGSGNRNYHNSSICKYIIEPENASTITLSFNEFSTEPVNDKLRVYNLVNQQLIGEYSGTEIPSDVFIPAGRAYVLFMTNAEVSAQGWEINYTSTITNVDQQDALRKKVMVSCSPNPAEGWLRIDIQSKSIEKIKMYLISVDGKTTSIHDGLSKQDKSTVMVDVANYAPGLYILKYITETEQGEIKVIIK